MEQKIRVLATPSAETVSKGLTERSALAVVKDLDSVVLAQSLKGLTENMGHIFDNIPVKQGFNLTQVTASIEISAEGGVTLIGTMTAGAKGAVQLVFERQK